MRRREPAFCFGIFGIAKAPWRPTVHEAMQDALDAGYAAREEYNDTLYLIVPGEIWESCDLVPVVPRDVWKAKAVKPAEPAQLSRIERIIARREAGRKKAG